MTKPGGGEGSRTPDPMVANHVLCQLSYTPDKIRISKFEFRNFQRGWLRGRDLNPRPLGYEPNELPDCSTPRQSQTKHPESPKFRPRFVWNVNSNPKSKIRNSKFVGGPG